MHKASKWTSTGLALALILSTAFGAAAQAQQAQVHWHFAPIDDGSLHSIRYQSAPAWAGWKLANEIGVHRFDAEPKSRERIRVSSGAGGELWQTPWRDRLRLQIGARFDHAADWEMGLDLLARYSSPVLERSLIHPVEGFVEIEAVPVHGAETGAQLRAGLTTQLSVGLGVSVAGAWDPDSLYGGSRGEIGVFWPF